MTLVSSMLEKNMRITSNVSSKNTTR
ncbi:hypothetical protein ACHAW6_007340 [Cyclotella cf. meneghiniana]